MKKRKHLIDRPEPIHSWRGDQTANCGAIVPRAAATFEFEGDLTSMERFLEQYRKSIYSCKECAKISITHKYLYEVAGQEAMSSEEAQ